MKRSSPEALWFLSGVGQRTNLLRVWEGQALEKSEGGLIPFIEWIEKKLSQGPTL